MKQAIYSTSIRSVSCLLLILLLLLFLLLLLLLNEPTSMRGRTSGVNYKNSYCCTSPYIVIITTIVIVVPLRVAFLAHCLFSLSFFLLFYCNVNITI
ncbi:hypothetical protein T492DRAFT_1068282 [Pavlovales sp. CCMP2436]|nr:hypothetical protein T492DRAFT_1068282 [Pavlovales sp. CCMP2436]